MFLTQREHYDLVIVGAGMVGASLAVALTQADSSSLRILLVEASSIQSEVPAQPGFDARSTVLSASSAAYFEQLGLWAALSAAAEPIKQIQVSEQGRFGTVQLDSATENTPALGYVVENATLGTALNQALLAAPQLEVCAPAAVNSLKPVPEGMQLVLQRSDTSAVITAALVVLAEGGRSNLCAQLGIAHSKHNYQQSAIIANVALSQPHANVAYERFTAKGPVALLPLADRDGLHRAALVWTHRAAEVDAILALDDAAFLQHLQQDFGQRAGSFIKAGKRVAFPLSLQLAQEQIRPGLVLLGNVVHSLHPVAGQGFNLALRDTMALAQNILESSRRSQAPGDFARLQDYVQTVARDQGNTISFSDYMTRLFSSSSSMLVLARKFGMASIDLVPPLKHQLSRHAMGLAQPQVVLRKKPVCR